MELIITCEHGKNSVPLKFRHLFQSHEKTLNSHLGYDPGALSLAKKMASYYEAPFVYGTQTRLLVELNRSLHHPKLFSKYTIPLGTKEKEELLHKYYHPYRDEVREVIDFLISEGEQVLHLSIHSFTPILNGLKRNCDIGLLFDPQRSSEKRFCALWKEQLKEDLPSLCIRKNFPYKGTQDGLVTELRKRYPKSRYTGIELEVNQKHPEGNPKLWNELQKKIILSLEPLLL